jgi:integrase/recombinase XerC
MGCGTRGDTETLEVTRGDVRAVQRFSRHRDLRTLMIYDDGRKDLAGQVARRLAG